MKKILILISLLFTALLFTSNTYAMPKPDNTSWIDVSSSIGTTSYHVNQSRFQYTFTFTPSLTYDYIFTFQGTFDNTTMFGLFGNKMLYVKLYNEFNDISVIQRSYSLDASLNYVTIPYTPIYDDEDIEFYIEISIVDGSDLKPNYHSEFKTALDTNLKIYGRPASDGMGTYINDLNTNTYIDAYNQGYGVGYTNGYSYGYQLGYGVGYNDAKNIYDLDYQQWYDDGYQLGYNQGYGVGFDDGYDAELDFENILSWVFMPFTLLTREIAFGITIGHLVMIPIVFGLMGFLFSLKKGKK